MFRGRFLRESASGGLTKENFIFEYYQADSNFVNRTINLSHQHNGVKLGSKALGTKCGMGSNFEGLIVLSASARRWLYLMHGMVND